VLDGLAQRAAHVGLGERGERAEQRVADVAPGGGDQAEQVPGRRVEPFHPLEQQVAQAVREFGGPARVGREEFFGEERVAFGTGDDGVGQRGVEQRGRRGASSAVRSSGGSGPRSSTRPEPERRTPSASRAIRLFEAGSSCR